MVSEISAAIERVANEEKVVNWGDFLQDMKNFVIEMYDGSGLINYKGDWKRRFKAAARILKYKVSAGVDDCRIEEKQPQLKAMRNSAAAMTSATSATESKKKISDEDKSRVLQLYDSIKTEDK